MAVRTLLVVASAALSMVLACRPSLDATYTVTPSVALHRIVVELGLVHLDGRDLDLRGYGAADAMQVTNVRATSPDGRTYTVVAATDTTRVKGQLVDLPRFRVVGPLPHTLRLRYEVTPGRKEGDDHLGYSGQVFSYLGPDYALLSGREIFLVPQPSESARRMRVRFQLPAGWRALVPWPGNGSIRKVPSTGTTPAEHLISSPIGLGNFSIRSLGKRVRVAFTPGVSPSDQERASIPLERGIDYVGRLMGRDLGGDYLLLLAPKTPDGYRVMTKAWATGQGGTFLPLTTGRMRELMREYLRAYVQYAPFRRELRRTEDLWLVDAVANWYSLKATAAAGLGNEREMTRSFGLAYLTASTSEGIHRNLETLYADARPDPAAKDALAPFALFYLDHVLRTKNRLSDGVDPYVRLVFRRAGSRSLWSMLPAGAWDAFRRRYVLGETLAPVPDLLAEPAPTPTPVPPRGPPVKRFTLIYTGNGLGFIENCGCKSNQSGGVARRATVIESLRTADPEAVLLDAGNTFARPDAFETPTPFAAQEQRLYLQTMERTGYQAAAIGPGELARGVPYFRTETRGITTPFLCSNLEDDRGRLAPASVIVRTHGERICVIGVLEPIGSGREMPGFVDAIAGMELSDPVRNLRSEADRLRGHVDLVVAIGNLSPSTVRRVGRECPDVDIVISTDFETPAWVAPESSHRRMMRDRERPGFLGRTLVLNAAMSQYGLTSVEIELDRSHEITEARSTDHWLYESVPDEPKVRHLIDRFYEDVGRTSNAQAGIRGPLSDMPPWRDGVFVGAQTCKECHEPEYAQWKTTAHAGAYKTLLDRHRHYQPVCVSCHVVGFGTRNGYRLGQKEEPLGNVQCEDCHGPGAEHVKMPDSGTIQARVPEQVCIACHTPDHSDHFVYSSRILRVQHRESSTVAAR